MISEHVKLAAQSLFTRKHGIRVTLLVAKLDAIEKVRRLIKRKTSEKHDELQTEDPPPFGPRPPAPRPPKPQRDAGVRALYHKLALRFHPDRAQDEERRAEHEAVMREVNDAYHGGDSERMLALSRELDIDVGDLQASDGLLGELVAQYEAIKAEVRDSCATSRRAGCRSIPSWKVRVGRTPLTTMTRMTCSSSSLE